MFNKKKLAKKTKASASWLARAEVKMLLTAVTSALAYKGLDVLATKYPKLKQLKTKS